MSVIFKGMQVATAVLVLGFYGCGAAGPTIGPSPVTAPPPGTVSAVAPLAASAPPVLPPGLDPAYVRALVTLDPAGFPPRWEGGFSHCGAVDETLADELSTLSGIPRTAGPCNVEWIRVHGAGHSNTALRGTARALSSARITLYDDDHMTRSARHELGHVLGLEHSPRPADLMVATPTSDTFSADELAVLAWMYGR